MSVYGSVFAMPDLVWVGDIHTFMMAWLVIQTNFESGSKWIVIAAFARG